MKDENEVWDLYWTDLSVSVERVSKMHPFQCINHFPGMLDICRKVPFLDPLRFGFRGSWSHPLLPRHAGHWPQGNRSLTPFAVQSLKS